MSLRGIVLLACLAMPSWAFIHAPPISIARRAATTTPLLSKGGKMLDLGVRIRTRSGTQLSMMGIVPFNTLAIACTAPTLLGFWRSEYGVSYAYGGAMFLAGALALNAGCATPIGALHALCFCLYGLRLNLFLMYRELNIPTFKKIRERIEERAQQRGNRLTRAPFLFFCSLLYLGMVSALQITASSVTLGPVSAVSVGVMYCGFLLAAVGDSQKTMEKMGDADLLVTKGLFSVLRHPNFTGEFIMWSASFVAGLSAVITTGALKAATGWLIGSAIGTIGIAYVLAQAATNLEKRQLQKYGGREEYQKWIKTTWPGPVLSTKK